MNTLIAVAMGGALGAVMRWEVQRLFAGSTFPWGTWLVNVLGSFAIGIIFVWLAERSEAPEWLRTAMMVGVLGALTTFSTYSLDSIRLLEMGEWSMATANILGQVVVCLLLTWVGMQFARWMF